MWVSISYRSKQPSREKKMIDSYNHEHEVAIENYQVSLCDLADKHLDAALARGEAFSEGLCNWAVSMAEQEVSKPARPL